jgi:hypothetical protein
MRRVIAVAVVGGLALGGAVAAPSVAAASAAGKGPVKARPAAPAKSPEGSKTTDGMKTVVYAGYEIQVPVGWPVYRLDEYPRTCVRYDVHAVYLGRPGTNMRCPAGAVGRTQTVSIIPDQGAAAGPGGGSTGHTPASEEAADTEIQELPAVHSAIMQNVVQHNLEVKLSGTSGATVLGTYGTDPELVERLLATLRPAPAGSAPTAQSPSPPGGTTAGASQRAELSSENVPMAPPHASAAPAPAAPNPAAKASATKAAGATPNPTYTNWRGVPTNWPVEIVQPSPPPRQPTPPVPPHPVGGFDTCTAPSVATMSAWHSDYSAVGVYLGGANAACAGGNLSASWVKTVAAAGWGLLPAYVGPQAPCWGGTGVPIDPGSAVAEGKAAASDAVSDARALGLAAGSPIYYDMEAYRGSASCTTTVLEFLGAWNQQVQAEGYVTGMYSSQDSGVADVQQATADKMAGFTPPESVWVALWDNVPSLSGGNVAWSSADRSKQYTGNVNETVGGITLEIDKDIVDGPVARLSRGCAPRRCESGSHEPPRPHKLTTWPYAATVLTPSST